MCWHPGRAPVSPLRVSPPVASSSSPIKGPPPMPAALELLLWQTCTPEGKGCITARACDVDHLQVCQKHPAEASTGARCSALWLDEGISDSSAIECSYCCNCCRLHKMPQDTGKIPQNRSMNLTTVGPNIPKTLRFLCVIGRYLTGFLRLQEKQNTPFFLSSSQDDRFHRGVRPDRRYLTGIFPVS